VMAGYADGDGARFDRPIEHGGPPLLGRAPAR
jgi:hypothetical protein